MKNNNDNMSNNNNNLYSNSKISDNDIYSQNKDISDIYSSDNSDIYTNEKLENSDIYSNNNLYDLKDNINESFENTVENYNSNFENNFNHNNNYENNLKDEQYNFLSENLEYEKDFAIIFNLIKDNDLDLAEVKLQELEILVQEKNKEKALICYLFATIYYKKNWTLKSREYLEKSIKLNPENEKYLNTLKSLEADINSENPFNMEYPLDEKDRSYVDPKKNKKRKNMNSKNCCECCAVCLCEGLCELICEGLGGCG